MFAGIKHGRHIVRLYPPRHLEPEPIAFAIDPQNRLRELDIRLDRGRDVSIVVIDSENDPAPNAKVFAVADSRLCSRGCADGREQDRGEVRGAIELRPRGHVISFSRERG